MSAIAQEKLPSMSLHAVARIGAASIASGRVAELVRRDDEAAAARPRPEAPAKLQARGPDVGLRLSVRRRADGLPELVNAATGAGCGIASSEAVAADALKFFNSHE